MVDPLRREDTSSHAPRRTKTGRSVAGPLCGIRGLSGYDVCLRNTVGANRTAGQCASGSDMGLYR